MALSILALLSVASGCDDHHDTSFTSTGTTNPVSAVTRAAQLLDALAAGDSAKFFDKRYVAFFADGAALFIGTRADTAIGYYCNPLGSAWLGGSNDFGQLQLVAPNGVGFVGANVAGRTAGRLSGTKTHDGDVTLVDAADTVLERRGTIGRISGPLGSCQ